MLLKLWVELSLSLEISEVSAAWQKDNAIYTYSDSFHETCRFKHQAIKSHMFGEQIVKIFKCNELKRKTYLRFLDILRTIDYVIIVDKKFTKSTEVSHKERKSCNSTCVVVGLLLVVKAVDDDVNVGNGMMTTIMMMNFSRLAETSSWECHHL
ncbi:hypothetical protein FF38_04131 [Lucilia cuprina]|uniref:Uncharacterized protein n=1 Tax=Lucilia cuprina TaxID=7375 RepID=A0A0L0BRX2_LUCCU|nr:hypothetical protein FF38_04131 [Lucilia cuprina]